jgi:hypothetical protein
VTAKIYASAVNRIERLHRDLASRFEPSEFAAADTVPRAVLADDHTQGWPNTWLSRPDHRSELWRGRVDGPLR